MKQRTKKAICEKCGLVQADIKIRDVPFSDGNGVVENIFTGVCPSCEEVIFVPNTSVDKIKEEYNKR